MHEILFQINYQLCREFKALSPYEVDARTFEEVIELYADTRSLQIANSIEAQRKQNEETRRPAGDDWF